MMKSRTGLIIVPVIIGLGVVVWLFAREFSIEAWRSIHWSLRTAGGQ